MTEADVRAAPLLEGSCEAALHAVATAAGWVRAAKRTHSPALVARAERDVQAAVDGARELGVQWGQIGLALGIARGNAYQRYRKPLSRGSFPTGVPPRAQIA